ncbi:MAG: twin-arginine translocase subunit TatC [Candidatus Obscuribacterales bacterium]|nr:twin-arginine translocase subunit TatC [Candidatus Obscuribacterales bacterium]
MAVLFYLKHSGNGWQVQKTKMSMGPDEIELSSKSSAVKAELEELRPHELTQAQEAELETELDLDQLPETVPAKFPQLAVENAAEIADESEESEEGDGKVMTVVDHLDELRGRLIRSLAVFSISMALCFAFGREIIQVLEKPAGAMQFQALSIEEPVLVYLKVSFYAALALASPYLLYEISAFISPGLKAKERRILAPIIIGGPALFVSGVVFCYYLVLPPMLSFFNAFSTPIAPVQQRLDSYISLVTTMLFYMGICFQLPIVLFALSLAGLVNSRQLLSFWRYAAVASSVVAAIITPDPTVISMLIVMGALIGLYFFTILLLKVFGR